LTSAFVVTTDATVEFNTSSDTFKLPFASKYASTILLLNVSIAYCPTPLYDSVVVVPPIADTEYITNVKYTYDDVVTTTDTVEVCSPVFVDDTLTTGKYKPYNNGNTNKSEAVYGTGNLMYCTSTFLDDTSTRRVYGLAVVPEELVGGRAILTPFDAGGLSNVEFDIITSSRVYIFTTTSSAGRLAKLLETLGEGWVNTSFTHEDTDLNDKDIAIAYRSSDSAINENIKNERSFYKEFYVQPDDKAHISIPLSTYGLEGQKAVIIIKPLSE